MRLHWHRRDLRAADIPFLAIVGNHETKRRENAGIKDTSSTDLGTTDKKSADKNPSGGNEIPSADEVSIPSSVDPDAPANTEGDNTDGPNSSESTE